MHGLTTQIFCLLVYNGIIGKLTQLDYQGEIIDGTLKDEQISHWLKNASKSPTLEGVRKPAFRILFVALLFEENTLEILTDILRYGDGYLGVGRDDVRMPFTKERMDEIMTNFRLPGAFLPMMHEETTRYSGFTLFDDDGQVCGECEFLVYHVNRCLCILETTLVSKLHASMLFSFPRTELAGIRKL